jgi:hypothetical protein
MTPNWQRTASNAASSNGSASVGVSPADPGKAGLRCCKIEHVLTDVARNDRHRLGEHASKHAGDEAGPRGDFEQASRAESSHALCQVASERLKEDRSSIAVVKRRYRARI